MASSYTKDSIFLGSIIPTEIESMCRNLKDLDHEMFRKILKGKRKQMYTPHVVHLNDAFWNTFVTQTHSRVSSIYAWLLIFHSDHIWVNITTPDLEHLVFLFLIPYLQSLRPRFHENELITDLIISVSDAPHSCGQCIGRKRLQRNDEGYSGEQCHPTGETQSHHSWDVQAVIWGHPHPCVVTQTGGKLKSPVTKQMCTHQIDGSP